MLLLFVGCSKEEGNGFLRYSFTSDNDNSGFLNFNSGYFTVKQANFTGNIKGVASSSYNLLATNKVKIISSSREIGNEEIPVGKYQNVSISFKIGQNQANLDPGLSLTGEFTDNSNQKIPIQLNFSEEFTSTLSFSEKVTFQTDQKTTAVVSLDVQTLFSTMTKTELTNAVRVNGAIIIAVDPNFELYQKVQAQLPKSLELSFR
jgi:hypothetical protein